MIEHLKDNLVITKGRGHPPPIHRPWEDEEEDAGGDDE